MEKLQFQLIGDPEVAPAMARYMKTSLNFWD